MTSFAKQPTLILIFNLFCLKLQFNLIFYFSGVAVIANNLSQFGLIYLSNNLEALLYIRTVRIFEGRKFRLVFLFEVFEKAL